MATYRPAAYPRRAKHNTLYSEAIYQVKLAYYRYELTTGQYVMSSNEKVAYNLIVMLLLGLLFSAVYFSLPRTTITGLQRLVYYLTGSHHKLEMDVMKGMAGVIAQTPDSAASLSGRAASSMVGISNATTFAL